MSSGLYAVMLLLWSLARAESPKKAWQTWEVAIRCERLARENNPRTQQGFYNAGPTLHTARISGYMSKKQRTRDWNDQLFSGSLLSEFLSDQKSTP
jgi:hypothetical protein